MALAKPFPAPAFRRTRERASGLLFAFGVDDLSLDVPTGQTPTFTRAGARTVVDSAGRIGTIAYHQPPWSAVYNDGAALWEPTFDAQRAATNLCYPSEDFSTSWSAIGTPVLTSGALAIGDLSLDLIEDDASGTLEGYSRVVGFTADAVKAVAVFLKAGSSTSTVIRLRDTTAAADRLLVAIAWAGGVPTPTMTTGTLCGTRALADGVYRFLFQTTSVTAANTNQVEVYPATDAALATTDTGTVYAGGVQAENFEYPHAYIKTVAGTVTTVADRLSYPLTQDVADFTVYVRLARPVWADLTTALTSVCGILNYEPSGAGAWELYHDNGARGVTAVLTDSVTTSVSTFASLPSSGVYEICAQFVDITTAGKVRLDVGSGFGSYSGTTGPISSWSATTLHVGQLGSTEQNDAGIRRVIIAPGARTLAELQGVST